MEAYRIVMLCLQADYNRNASYNQIPPATIHVCHAPTRVILACSCSILALRSHLLLTSIAAWLLLSLRLHLATEIMSGRSALQPRPAATYRQILLCHGLLQVCLLLDLLDHRIAESACSVTERKFS